MNFTTDLKIFMKRYVSGLWNLRHKVGNFYSSPKLLIELSPLSLKLAESLIVSRSWCLNCCQPVWHQDHLLNLVMSCLRHELPPSRAASVTQSHSLCQLKGDPWAEGLRRIRSKIDIFWQKISHSGFIFA